MKCVASATVCVERANKDYAIAEKELNERLQTTKATEDALNRIMDRVTCHQAPRAQVDQLMAETKSIVRAEEGNRAYAGSGTWQETPRQTLGLTSSEKYQAWLEQTLRGGHPHHHIFPKAPGFKWLPAKIRKNAGRWKLMCKINVYRVKTFKKHLKQMKEYVQNDKKITTYHISRVWTHRCNRFCSRTPGSVKMVISASIFAWSTRH